MRRALVLILAIACDLVFGDPPNTRHPVAWLGRWARTVEGWSPRTRGGGGRAALTVTGAALAVSAMAVRSWPVPLGGRTAGETALVWACTGRRSLFRHATEVAGALDAGELDEARRLLSYHLVSRDTSLLTAAEVAGAAVESVAENLSDGVVAPWLWYATAGVPGVATYRVLNTLDGMWGYRTPEYVDFGKVAARADDVMNLVPARLTALVIIAASLAGRPDARRSDMRRALRSWAAGRQRTLSPNAGHPMSAMAGALGVVLEKRGEYQLGEGGREPMPGDIYRAVNLAERASWLAAGGLVAISLARGVRR